MPTKISVLIVLAIVCPVILIISLFWAHGNRQQKKNGFIRRMLSNPKMDKSIILDNASWYIAGTRNDQLYLCNYGDPESILTLHLTTSDTQHLAVKIRQDLKIAWSTLKCATLNEQLLAYEGNVPNIFQGNIHTRILERLPVDSIRFDQLVPVSSASFVVRKWKDGQGFTTLFLQHHNVLSTTELSLDTGHAVGFASDGALMYDQASAKLVYLYTYANRFLSIDTGLLQVYQHHSIDTIRHPQLITDTLVSKNKVILAAPPLIVNRRGTAAQGLLFIHSGLKADNELSNAFDLAPVIDVYHIADGSYRGSFYLPNFSTGKLTDLKASANHLIAMNGEIIQVYRLPAAFTAAQQGLAK